MKIFVIGGGGFLGSRLVRALAARGHEVRTSSSRDGSGDVRIRLGELVDAAIFGESEVVIHNAHDFAPGNIERNVTGARILFDAAAGRRRIFVSSHSARADAASEYGIAKYRIERFYLEAGENVVRPGLVIGDGGLFGRYLRTIRSLPVIPLIDGGRDLVPVLAVADYCAAMVCLVESGVSGAFNLFSERQPAMREVIEAVSGNALLIPVPWGLAYGMAAVAHSLHVKLPFERSSLETIKLNRRSVHKSNLRALLEREMSLEDAVAAISR
jgi:NADH dehydrogenase